MNMLTCTFRSERMFIEVFAHFHVVRSSPRSLAFQLMVVQLVTFYACEKMVTFSPSNTLYPLGVREKLHVA